jgi:hypothetical protein
MAGVESPSHLRHFRKQLRATQPTGFLWDWLGMAAPFPGTGCITVNGMFLAWTRSTRADLDASADILEQALGAAMEEHEQMEWPLE